MNKKAFLGLSLALSFLTMTLCSAQTIDLSPLPVLQQKLKEAKSDKEKIYLLCSISGHYLMDGNHDSLAAVYADHAVQLANRSRKQDLVAYAALTNGSIYQSSSGVNDRDRLTQAKKYLEQCIQISVDNSLPFYQAGSYLGLSSVYSNPYNADYGKALQYINQAQPIITTLNNDSLKVEADLDAGLCYLYQGQNISAYRYMSNALYLAEQTESLYLTIQANLTLAELYGYLEDYDKALDAVTESLDLLKPVSREYKLQLIAAYNKLWKISEQKKDYDQAIAYAKEAADTLIAQQMHPVIISTVQMQIFSTYLDQKKYKKALAFINNRPELLHLLNTYHQVYQLHYVKADMYKSFKQLDSSEYFFGKTIPVAENLASPYDLMDIYTDYGFLQIAEKHPEKGIQYLQKAKDLAGKINDIYSLKYAYYNLDSAQAGLGALAKAYPYRVLYDQFKDSLREMSKGKQLAMLQVNSEERRLKQEHEKMEAQLRRDHNLQYMAIAAGLATIFILLVFFGVFTTSAAVIRGLGFFAFIFFFEFIVLLLDQLIRQWTGEIPWKVLLFKICIIALIFPFHHYIQDKVVDHLIHRKKLKLHVAVLKRKAKTKSQ